MSQKMVAEDTENMRPKISMRKSEAREVRKMANRKGIDTSRMYGKLIREGIEKR